MSNQPPFAEYPRPSQGPSFGAPYGRGPGVYFDAIGESWGIVKKDLGTWIAATIVTAAIYYAMIFTVNLAIPPLTPAELRSFDLSRIGGRFALQMALTMIPASIFQIMIAGMIAMGVKKLRGEYINVGMIFEPFRSFGTLFLTSLLYSLVTFAATMACLLPGLFFTPVLMLMPAVAFMKNVGPVEALSITFDTCKAHWAGLLGLYILIVLLALVGSCACLVGALFTAPMCIVVLAIHYRAFFESSQSPYAEGPAVYPSA